MPTRSPQRASSTKRGYGARWQKVSKGHLRNEPWCRRCRAAGRMVRATNVDHITPHRGDPVLFWARDNRQSLCNTCHSGDKQSAEKGGELVYRGCAADGTPLDPSHRWNVSDGNTKRFGPGGSVRPASPLTRDNAN